MEPCVHGSLIDRCCCCQIRCIPIILVCYLCKPSHPKTLPPSRRSTISATPELRCFCVSRRKKDHHHHARCLMLANTTTSITTSIINMIIICIIIIINITNAKATKRACLHIASLHIAFTFFTPHSPIPHDSKQAPSLVHLHNPHLTQVHVSHNFTAFTTCSAWSPHTPSSSDRNSPSRTDPPYPDSSQTTQRAAS